MGDQSSGYELCTSEFWNTNTTWNNDRPYFSQCFRDTALVWIPGLFFLFVIFVEPLNIRDAKLHKFRTIPWNLFNRTRLAATLILFFLRLGQLISLLYIQYGPTDTTVPGADSAKILVISSILAPVIQATCLIQLFITYYRHRKVGIHTSASIWFYLLSLILCGFVELYSVIMTTNQSSVAIVEYTTEYIHCPISFFLFVLECRGDTPVLDVDSSDGRPDSPELRASFFSNITFWWFNSFLVYGYKYQLKLSSLWKTLVRDRADRIVPIFRDTWARSRASKRKDVYSLANGEKQHSNNINVVLLKLFWSRLLLAASLKLIQDSLQYVTPLILKRLLNFMKTNGPLWHGILFALLLLIVPTIQSIVLGNYFYRMQIIGTNVRTMIIGAIYRKALLLSGSSRMQSTSGEIVNLMAVDSHRYQDLLMYLNLIWSAPFQITVAVSLLYQELGWSVFAGVACMALVLPVNAYLASRIKLSQVKLMKTKDERVKQMNEVLSGVKVIKLYAWENSFIANLFRFRSKELGYLSRILNLDALQAFLWQCSPFIVSLVTFAVYVMSDPANVLDAEKAFVSIALFNLLRFPLTMLPALVTSLVLTLVSSRRLNRFLNNNELVRYVSRNEEIEAISIEGATLAWSKEDTEDTADKQAILKDIELHVKPGSFVAIVGQVASGKSSLLAAILGEMHRLSGRFNVPQSMSMAYVPQQAWIQNMSVKDNILFGQPLDEAKYKQILSVCSLQSDLDTLPGGDESEIGEKGINLSGGQKQRVSLARACYSDSDIYLLDDPLSALDSHVAKHVFERVLSSSSGLLRTKTRVLATNSLFVLPYTDQIVVLDKGRVVEAGTYRELMEKPHGHLADFMHQYSGSTETGQVQVSEEQATSPGEKRQVEPALETKTLKSAMSGRLIESERMETGSVSGKVYLNYFKAVSLFWMGLVAFWLLAATGFNVATNMWLSFWSADAEKPDLDPDLKTTRLSVYAILGACQCLGTLFASLALSRGAVKGARRLHARLLDGVMHSPMTFFDTTPIGRIVNRFAKDIDVVDSVLPGTFRSWLNCFLQVVSTLFVICYSFPTFFIIIVPLGIIYYLVQRVFIKTTRQLKRLESTTRSPIYSHFNETLAGMSCIRAYDCIDRFICHSDTLVDRNQSCSYPNVIANRWLSVRLELFGNIVTACAGLFSVYYRGTVGSDVAGLTISYSMSITQTLSWLVRMTSDLETHIVSVERILEYIQNRREDLWLKQQRPPDDWPAAGAIEIRDYSTRYRDDTDLVIKGLSLSVRPSEKVGIVGRTGSGKSSLSLALFRILEPQTGSISIDKLNIVDYGLHDLRSKLTIIPQDPVLFSGSLRFNLDPLGLYSDLEIWRALELAHLKAYIGGLKLGLDYKVIEYGENFSVGQRQLICLARAILRKSKILVLDEATASVDLETDSIVQETIRKIFADCTIITIAHRLHTILDSDRILVLEQGQVKELGSPMELIEDSQSTFSSLVRDAGIERDNVIKIAGERRAKQQPQIK